MKSKDSLTGARRLAIGECFGEIASHAARGKVVFVAGAGVSMGPPGRLPGWEGMMLAILREIAGPKHASEVELFRPHMKYLFNEVMLRRLVVALSRHAPGAAALHHVGELLQACLSFRGCNLSHATIAWAASKFGNSLFTMNFDMLFENACIALGVAIDIPKLHGSLDDLNGARFTFDQVMSPLTDNLKDRGRHAMADCTMAVAVGYNGQDEFDVMPLLFEQPSPLRKILWIVHDTGNSPKLPFESEYAKDKRLTWCRVNTEALWRHLLKTLGTRGGTPELELNWMEPKLARNPHWWKKGVAKWGERMRRTHAQSLAYLWADLLDEMRIYRDGTGQGVSNNPAANAYERAIKTSAPGSSESLFSRAQLAIIQQRLGQGLARDFIKIRSDIRAKLEAAVTGHPPMAEKDQRALQDLYARCVYFQGKLAQNQHYHAEADKLFELAQNLWLVLGDVEAMSALFLEFMNAFQASSKGLADIDYYAPADWRRTLAPALEKAANAMKASHDYDRYATMIHNRAFVLQTMANELLDKNQGARGRALLQQALSEYYLGFHYRIRLRDPRGIAQSRVRICECELPLTAALLDSGQKIPARKKLGNVRDHIAAVEEFYKQIPHEQLRNDDLDRVKRLYRKLLARAEH